MRAPASSMDTPPALELGVDADDTREAAHLDPRRCSQIGPRCSQQRAEALRFPAPGRIAQRESARFTRERSLVRSQVRPLKLAGAQTPGRSLQYLNERERGEHVLVKCRARVADDPAVPPSIGGRPIGSHRRIQH
jgi:hypothetical protein